LGCGEGEDSQQAPLLLARHPERLFELRIPQDSRDGLAPGPVLALSGWQRIEGQGELPVFEAPLPARPRELYTTLQPEGMELELSGEPLRYSWDARAEGPSWFIEGRQLRLSLPEEPQPGQLALRYPKAEQRERELNRRWAAADDDESFVFRTAQQDETSRTGLLLPAPSQASWQLHVPAGAQLSLEAAILEPELADMGRSDGARLRVLVDDALLGELDLDIGRFQPLQLDLSPWAGEQVELSLRTEPGDSALLDYVFVAEPTVYQPQEDPPRILLIFVDTLRRDRLGLYGYSRPTTPFLDAWAEDAMVFEMARSVAPWTLPAARAFLSGRQPEEWDAGESLPVLLGRGGWETGAFVGNVYLSSTYGMHEGWSRHWIRVWPRAQVVVDEALAWLERCEDRPALAMVHLMDLHLPYTEPQAYRGLFAGQMPAALEGALSDPEVMQAIRGEGAEQAFRRPDVLRALAGGRDRELERYVSDRYDGSLRYVDDQLGRLLEGMGERDMVTVFSDHGEEFWDHGGFEHGHTLYDELLRVPLLIKGPGVQAGRIETPVSLADLAPTVLQLAGLQGSGRSLLDDSRTQGPIAFGRTLYKSASWGVLRGESKWVTTKGRAFVFDVATDPRERDGERLVGLAASAPFATAMGEGLERPVVQALRCSVGGRLGQDVELELELPQAPQRAWVEGSVLAEAPVVELEGAGARVRWGRKFSVMRELFVEPAGAAEQALGQVALRLNGEQVRWTLAEGELRARVGELELRVRPMWVPVPEGDAAPALEAEAEGALRALGYLD